jgi:hypothetical protein
MICHVLGLGESLDHYRPDGSPTVGVNDIYTKHPVDYLVSADKPRVFTPGRLKVIINSAPKKFYAFTEDWRPYFTNFALLNQAKPRHDVSQLDSDNTPISLCSPFVAAIIAYKLGANDIVLWGVDLISHKNLSADDKVRRIIKDFKALELELRKRNRRLFIGHPSTRLHPHLPLFQKGRE